MKLIFEKCDNFLFEMANIRGKTVKCPKRLDFSFFFSTKDAVESKELVHGLRVKPVFNPEKISIDKTGTLKLHGDWEYIPGEDDVDVSSRDVRKMKAFFATYKILFSAVWEKVLPHDAVEDYFRGHINFEDVLKEFYFYDDFRDDLDIIETFDDLTDFVETNKLFNTWNK